MAYVPELRNYYREKVVPALMQQFSYTSIMQVPRLEKIVLNAGVGQATEDKKLVEQAQAELTQIAGQKAVITHSKRDISNFKVRRGNPIGTMVTLRRDKMYEFLDRLINVSLPRIRDFQGLPMNLDGRGNYTMGLKEQIVFPEIDIDKVSRISGIEITFVTSAQTDAEGLALLREFGMPFKSEKKE
jgi:50S ribosomal protein L5